MPITDQEIERLENAANDCLKPNGYLTAEHFNTVANPSTILSLIERLRELEAMVHDAYQFAGNILDIAGLFEHPEGQRALDYFSRGKADPEWRWPKEDISCGKVGGDDDPR